jgi:hypothetical protein
MKFDPHSLWDGPDFTTWIFHGTLSGLFCLLFIVYPHLAPFAPAMFYLFRELEQMYWTQPPLSHWGDHIMDVAVPTLVVSVLAYLLT